MTEEQVSLSLPLEEALRIARQAVTQSGLSIRDVRQDQDVIIATVAPSIRSFGETITIRSEPMTPNQTRLHIASGSAQLIDWGKNRENIRRIKTALDKLSR